MQEVNTNQQEPREKSLADWMREHAAGIEETETRYQRRVKERGGNDDGWRGD